MWNRYGHGLMANPMETWTVPKTQESCLPLPQLRGRETQPVWQEQEAPASPLLSRILCHQKIGPEIMQNPTS